MNFEISDSVRTTYKSNEMTSSATGQGIVIERLDHLVLTVRNIDASIVFYTQVVGMKLVTFKGNRKALSFGQQKINLHELGKEFEPKASNPTPGSADICLIAKTALDDVMRHLESCGVAIEEGPVMRTGALGPIKSVYFRDPDKNLIEVSKYEVDD
ncbi:glyoxalase domain-containing protein 5-like [Asterias rubens]|uniref:glyoxalase domain-containing protein 5-like n=1 Tax=Asterias rubens TaxID=7604 RepID=UPI001454F2B9|nr:glyoxalase domain-containing protein 5-like [Asterias rubens]